MVQLNIPWKTTYLQVFRAPDATMTRAMMVTVLYRMAGSPAAGNSQFSDVPANIWYAEAVSWAASNGVVNGVGNNLFAPEENITREQMAVMLHNYCLLKNVTLPTTTTAHFSDAAAISDWAKSAVQAMANAGILKGMGDHTFVPRGNATRAEVAQMFMNFLEAMK